MNATTSRVSFRDTRSATVRQYLTRFRLFTPADQSGLESERHFNGTSRLHSNMGGDTQLLQTGWRIADGLFGMDGISYITMRPFEVNLIRYPAFDWHELHGNVMRIIESADPESIALTPELSDCPRRRIRWFDTRSAQVRNYGVTSRLFTPLHSLDAERWIPGTSGDRKFTEAGTLALDLIRRIDGVSSLTIRPFEVNVFKYDHFTFAELHDRIIAALRLLFPAQRCGDSEVEVSNRAEY